MQQFEGTAALVKTASPEAKLRAKEMEKIGYKGDDAIEADEVKVYRAHVRLICVDVAFIVRARRAIALDARSRHAVLQPQPALPSISELLLSASATKRNRARTCAL